MRNGTKLVIGLLALAMALAIGLRFYLSSFENGSNILQQQGIAAARLGIDLSQEGRKLLPQEEQNELNSIYNEALQSLRQEERQRFFALSQKGADAEEQDLNESWMLMQKALVTLPQERRDRLFALIDKAVQLAQQKKAVSEKKPEGQ
jgi:hypothetical protein